MLDLPAIGKLFDQHYRNSGDTLFRLENLPQYTVASDGPNYQLWLDGAESPDMAQKQPWLDTLRSDHVKGLVQSRVRIFSEHLTDYERYACEFGYAYNTQAGEDIRVLHRGEHAIPATPTTPAGDLPEFWLINRKLVVVMHYDEHGRFEAGELMDDPAPFLAIRDALWDVAIEFTPWWNQHTELRRNRKVA